MTLIVVRDGIIAADTGTFDAYANVMATNRWKLYRGSISGRNSPVRTKVIFGISGNPSLALEACRAVVDGRQLPPDEPGEDGRAYALVVLTEEGEVYERMRNHPYQRRQDNAFVVIGSAFEFAYGALATGASAQKTVRAAIRHRSDVAGKCVAASFCDGRIGYMHLPHIPEKLEWLEPR